MVQRLIVIASMFAVPVPCLAAGTLALIEDGKPAYTIVVPDGRPKLALGAAQLLMRIVGRDPMNRKFDPDARSYWTPIDPDGSVSRPDKPF